MKITVARFVRFSIPHSAALTMLLLFLSLRSFSQGPGYTADDKVNAYNVPFGYGVNPGYYSGFDAEGVSYDVALAEIARKDGINAFRPTLPAFFFLQYGDPDMSKNDFNIRFSEFTQYKAMGIVNNVVFIGDATDHQDGDNATTLTGNQYRNFVKYSGCDKYSYEFKNMYEPIWDGGLNGTPVNENNYYALYVYKLASKYKDFIKVYEVVNEIDFLGTNTLDPDAVKGSNGGNNWFDRNPTPCELYNWRAPIFSYIRMLRITYEVVKTVDPSAFVAIGGIGFAGFLDAVLRNTDNPNNGLVDNVNYPRGGGAYFDVLSYHIYPQYDLRKKNPDGSNIYPFVYLRHSDEASERTVAKRDYMQSVLANYKYDGVTHPMKHFIITETNIPRRTYSNQDWIGSDDAQKNFVVKTMIKAQKKGIKQVDIFQLGETNDISDVSNQQGHMGLYINLNKARRTTAVKTPAGAGMQTVTALLDSLVYDASRTTALAMPATVDGAAFKTNDGKYVYVLWAKTNVDKSEVASAEYSFPAALNMTNVNVVDWNFTLTGLKRMVSPTNISLTGFPQYFTDASNPVDFNKSAGIPDGVAEVVSETKTMFQFSSYPNPARHEVKFSFTLQQPDVLSMEIKSIKGERITQFFNGASFSPGQHNITYDAEPLSPGMYIATLRGKTGLRDSVKVVIEK